MASLVAKQIIEIEDRATKPIEKITQGLENIDKKLDNVRKTSERTQNKTQGFFSKIGNTIKDTTKSFFSFNDALKGGLQIALAYIGLKSTFGYIIERSKYLVSMQNILHATSKEMDDLGKTMYSTSKNSVVSMSEMYQGTFELSRRLRNVNLVSASLEHVKNIAGSTKQGFTEAAQIYGDIYLAFEDSIKAGNTTLQDIADETAYSFDKTKGNLSDYLMFLQMTTAVIKQNGISLKETSAIYANMLGAGYGGSMGGTRIQTLLTELGNVEKRKKLAQNLGLNFKDLDIKSKGFINVLETIKNKTDKMTQSQKDARLQNALSPIQATTLGLLISMIDKLKQYKDAQDKIGFAEKGNQRVLNSTYGAWERLKNSVMSTGEAFIRWDGALAGVLNTLTVIWETIKSIISLDWTKVVFTKEGHKEWYQNMKKKENEYLEKRKIEMGINAKENNKNDFGIKGSKFDFFKGFREFGDIFSKRENINNINKNQNEVSIKVELETKDKNLKADATDIKVNNQNIKQVKIEKRNFDNY